MRARESTKLEFCFCGTSEFAPQTDALLWMNISACLTYAFNLVSQLFSRYSL